MNESEYKKMEHYKKNLYRFFELYEWLSKNYPDVLQKGIDAIN